MPIFILTFVGSLGFLAITVAMAKGRSGAKGVAWFCLVAAAGSLLASSVIFSPVWISQSILTLIAALVCAWFCAKPTAMTKAFVAATTASFAVALTISFFAYRNFELLREQFPVESMTDRLAYESQTPRVPAVLSSHVEQRLDASEQRRSFSVRHFMLKQLHERKTSLFVLATGFGVSRMTIPKEWGLSIPPAEPISLPPTQEPLYTPDGKQDQVQIPPAVAGRPSKDELLSMFSSGKLDFLDRRRIGLVQDRDHVVGFVPHRFTQMPESKTDFQLIRLELVSLLKHETPLAYVSEHLPQMDELRVASTRPLDNFERHALDQLRSDEDLVIDDAPNRIRMMGSLRAGKDCMECHSVRRGELLGAFSYELVGEREEKRLKLGA